MQIFRKNEYNISNNMITMYKKMSNCHNRQKIKNNCPICNSIENRTENTEQQNSDKITHFEYYNIHDYCLNNLIKCNYDRCLYFFNKNSQYNSKCYSCNRITCHSHQFNKQCKWCYYSRNFFSLWIIKKTCNRLYQIEDLLRIIANYNRVPKSMFFFYEAL